MYIYDLRSSTPVHIIKEATHTITQIEYFRAGDSLYLATADMRQLRVYEVEGAKYRLKFFIEPGSAIQRF